MRKCSKCGEYTFKDKCHNMTTKLAIPPKFSPEDKYWRQRLKAKGVLK